jgi:hypothetical protein
MSEFDLKGEVNIQTLPVSIATVRLGADGAPPSSSEIGQPFPNRRHLRV